MTVLWWFRRTPINLSIGAENELVTLYFVRNKRDGCIKSRIEWNVNWISFFFNNILSNKVGCWLDPKKFFSQQYPLKVVIYFILFQHLLDCCLLSNSPEDQHGKSNSPEDQHGIPCWFLFGFINKIYKKKNSRML